MNICAIVVTFNRLGLLKITLEKLRNQTLKLDKIIIINNASTDGTKEYLNTLNNEIFSIHNLSNNIGGAGGFNYGIKKAYELQYDLFWIMDDDTISQENSLENLIKGMNIIKEKNVGFVASNVLYKDNKPCLMNIPLTDVAWNEYAKDSIIKLKSTSFVSVIITRDAINRVGLPIKEFFLWGDDEEYTSRITNSGLDGYLIGNSIVHHYMNENVGIDIVKSSNDRVNRFFYEYRNRFYLNRNKGLKSILKYSYYVLKSLINVIMHSKDKKLYRISIILKGVIYGFGFNPHIEFCE